MVIIRIHKLTKYYGTQKIFENVEFLIKEGDKIALLGQNGTGKTTLINCISGDEDFDGHIDISKNIKISVMEQSKEFDDSEHNFRDFLKQKQIRYENKLKEFEGLLGNPEIYEDLKKYDKFLREYELLTSSKVEDIEEQKIKDILKNLNFEMHDYDKPIKVLSGGQKVKLKLAEALSKDCDLLILDEPTNHLDLKTRKWLENYIQEKIKTMLVISHDRYFIEELATKIVEIENHGLVEYNCKYSEYLLKRTKHLESVQKQYEDVTREKTRLMKSSEEKRRWAHVNAEWHGRVMADQLERRAKELPDLANPEDFFNKFELYFKNAEPTGTLVYEVKDLSKAFRNEVLFKKISFDINKGDKIALLGENGSGKTTLLKILCGLVAHDSGSVRRYYNIKAGYFDQSFDDLDKNKRIIEAVQDHVLELQDHQIISTLMKMGFPKEKVRNRIKTLSGGEKTRIKLLILTSKPYNVLFLDEPTNNLDLELIESLQDALSKFNGTIIFVSHDRYLIKKLATKIFRLGKGKLEIVEDVKSFKF